MKGQVQYDQLVRDLVAQMQLGNLVWRQPWFSRFPRNLHTGKDYQGLNVLLLSWAADRRQFKSRWWTTEKQALKRGGQIKDEEKAAPSFIIVGKWAYKNRKDERGAQRKSAYLMLRSYQVYNFEQTSGLEGLMPAEHHLDFQPLARAEQIITQFEGGPQLMPNAGCAYYSPFFDIVGLPDRSQFRNESGYYATHFHELAHSTGHPTRLKRFSFLDAVSHSADRYAKEELVAEIGGALICAEAGIANETTKDAAAYLASWLKALSDDKKLLFWAAANAQRACNWILNRREAKAKSAEAGRQPEFEAITNTGEQSAISPEAKDVKWE